MDWITGAIIGVLSAIGGAATAGVPLYLKLRTGLSTIRKGERDAVLEEYNVLIERFRKALDASSEELKKAREDRDMSRNDREKEMRDHSECLKLYARASERILSLEDALRAAKIPFRPWDEHDEDAAGSKTYPTLPKASTVQSPGGST